MTAAPWKRLAQFCIGLTPPADDLTQVNVRTTAPLTCVHDAAFGGGVYSVRHMLHGAVSLDGGDTWKGHREVYRDPLMQAQPPHSGDVGAAYSYGVELGSPKYKAVAPCSTP